MNRIESFIS